jgi:predicted AlkP superfamily pyrophosphatase or phosphodiesterase
MMSAFEPSCPNNSMRLIPLYCLFVVAFGFALARGEQVGTDTSVPPAANSTTHANSAAAESQQRTVDAIHHVLIISIDGLRPDLLVRAQTPNVRALCAAGSYTFWAETTPEAYTLPCHVSMLTGVSAEKHGVTWNEYIEQSYPNVPTLFDIAKKAGYSTAMATGKMKFIVFARPGALDDFYYPHEEPVSDDEVAIHAAALLRKRRPNVMFVHFPGVDTVGHEYGWGTDEQIAATEKADQAVGRIRETLTALDLADSTLVILTADHGGAAKSHEMLDPRSHFIPWIAVGPGVRKGFDLTRLGDRTVRIEDTFPTACAFLGLTPGSECQGRAVMEVLETASSTR